MKVAISIPNDLFKRAEALAGERKLSRSALYSKAIEEYVQAREDEAITAELDEVYAHEDSSIDPVMKEMQTHSMRLYDKW